MHFERNKAVLGNSQTDSDHQHTCIHNAETMHVNQNPHIQRGLHTAPE